MKIAASRRHEAAGALMVAAAIVYLLPFVRRGWIPHDEGMLGYIAEQVLLGRLPHVDFEEPYTGGLSWLYAAAFRIGGVDLLNIRWLLLAAAGWAAFVTYAILRRYAPPTTAALLTWVAVGWSFPNYFAGLPSWWLLVCALTCMWSMMRYRETRQARYIAAAGLAAGLAIVVKQTGVYLMVALGLALLYQSGCSSSASSLLARIERGVRYMAALAAAAFAAAVLSSRVLGPEGLYLLLPAVACALLLLVPSQRQPADADERSPLTLVWIAGTAAALPVACLLVPYVLHGALGEFVNGTIVLPWKRLAFASAPMRGASAIVTGVPLALLVFAPRGALGGPSMLTKSLLWTAAIAVPALALWHAGAYQLIWQSTRAIAALLPVGIAWRLISGSSIDPRRRSLLFLSAATLAWMSMNQFPFAAPIYFCYVAPLAVIAGAAATAECAPRPHVMLPWIVSLVLFAVLSANRGYLGTLGVAHGPQRFDVDLALPRAHLKVQRQDARIYRFLTWSIENRLRGGRLIAGPDAPDVYFLSDQVIPSGRLYDFFSAEAPENEADARRWTGATVIVINHTPHFSAAPSEELMTTLRREFPNGEFFGNFELRWRS